MKFVHLLSHVVVIEPDELGGAERLHDLDLVRVGPAADDDDVACASLLRGDDRRHRPQAGPIDDDIVTGLRVRHQDPPVEPTGELVEQARVFEGVWTLGNGKSRESGVQDHVLGVGAPREKAPGLG